MSNQGWEPYKNRLVKPLRKISSKRESPEANEQAPLVFWARSQGLTLISIPNAGKRSAWLAEKEKSLGLTPGVSDLLLCHPVAGLGGFWLEMKAPGRKPTAGQLDWMNKMRLHGYKADWFDNFEKAKAAIEDYLNAGKV